MARYMLQPELLLELKRWLSYYKIFWDSKLTALKNFVEDEDMDIQNREKNMLILLINMFFSAIILAKFTVNLGFASLKQDR